MNVQSTRAMSVNQITTEEADPERPPLVSAAIHTGKVIGFLAAARACAFAGRMVDKVINKDISYSLIIRPEPGKYHMTGATVGLFFVGRAAPHGLSALYYVARTVQSMGDQLSNYLAETTGCSPLAQESCVVKACACFGVLWSMFAGRESMYSLVGINNPYPDSIPCRVITGVGNEMIRDSTLLLVGGGAGYLAGKGIECVARKVCAGVQMAGIGVAAIVARPDVMVEPG